MINIRHSEIAVIGDEDLVSGMRLAGVRRYRIISEGDKEEVRRALSELFDEPDVGIVVILEDYMEYVSDLIAQAQERKASPPVVIEVPSKYGTRYKDVTQYYKAYIRKFIGFDIEV
ncbi:MAG: V-type ATP synthase subunit F [Dehalococcoidales bacterium]|jgi:vacuolar-type H+-ATPase subunit F/Vma7|nr:V-type ATP synthase subunit F [Dehalococcoidales bacterium]